MLMSESEIKHAAEFGNGIVELMGHRATTIRADMFAALQRDLSQVLGEVSKSILYMMGVSIGNSAFDLFGDRTAEEESTWRVLDSVFRIMGWGTIKSHTWRSREACTVTIENSFFSHGVRSTRPNCDVVRGILRGWVSSLYRSPVQVTENECIASGHPACTFRLVKGLVTTSRQSCPRRNELSRSTNG
jgi:predicted hydrocarbon binding protein